MQNEMSRKRYVISLSNSLVQEWKARYTCGGDLDSANKDCAIIDRCIVDLYGAKCTLRNNNYSDQRLSSYLGELYERGTCPLVRMVPLVVQYAMDTTERVMDLDRALGYKGNFSSEWMKLSDAHFCLLYMTRVWGKNLKYQSLYLFAYYEKLEDFNLPVRSAEIVGKDGDLCPGSVGKNIRRRLMGDGLKALESRFTILQGFKKSLLPLEEEDWFATVKDTRESLSAEAPDMSDDVYGEIVRTAKELAGRMGKMKVRKNYTLSKNSCVESSKKDGGFAGHFLRSEGFLKKEDYAQSVIYRISPPELVGDVRYDGCTEWSLIYSRCPLNYQDVWAKFQREIYQYLGKGSKVSIRVIPEPFKFRVISIGEYQAYSGLKPYQDMLWSCLQRFECFSLTGAGANDLTEKVGFIVTKWWDVGMKFLSGDYKNATNFLSSYASQVMVEEWCRDYPELKYILKNTLFNTRLDFDQSGKGVKANYTNEDVDGSQFETVDMQNGQLMGHPCSFPILCAVNAAICRMILEKVWNRRFSLDDIPLLINGDDCLLIGPNSLHQVWREKTQEVGLYESVGKSYFTDRFAMINSRYLQVRTKAVKDGCCNEQPFEMTSIPKDDLPDRYIAYVSRDVGYLNLGILVGRKKDNHVDCEVKVTDRVGDSSAFAFWQSAADNYQQMNLRCEKLRVPLGRYISSFKSYFSKIPLPLHLDKKSGGFGFPGEEELSLIYPRNPFQMKRDPKVMLGEAYFAGGMASVVDDQVFPNFLEVSKEVGKYLRKHAYPTTQIPTCAVEPKVERTWTVTTA